MKVLLDLLVSMSEGGQLSDRGVFGSAVSWDTKDEIV